MEKIALKTFYFCLSPCATLILFFVWNDGPPQDALPWIQFAASFFVVGLGAFLLWVTYIVRRIAGKESLS
jgi:hypothetical protein